MTMETKKEVFERYKKEYFKTHGKQIGGREKRTKIIDMIASITKMHRKSVIRVMSRLQKKDPTHQDQRGRALFYTPDVTVALKDIWEAGGEVCAELLHPIVREYVAILIRDKLWKHPDEATDKLLWMSQGTMKDRV